MYARFACAETKQARSVSRTQLRSKLAARRRSDAGGDDDYKDTSLTNPGILASPPAAQFPHFPSSWDLVASELAGALGDACRTSRAPRLLVDLKARLQTRCAQLQYPLSLMQCKLTMHCLMSLQCSA
jgi:hypothetical protein